MNWSTAKATYLKPFPLHDSKDVKGSLDEHCPCSQVTLDEVHKWLLAAHSVYQLSIVERFIDWLRRCSIMMHRLQFAPALSSTSHAICKATSALQLASHLLELVALQIAHTLFALVSIILLTHWRLNCKCATTQQLCLRLPEVLVNLFATSGLGGHTQLKFGSCKTLAAEGVHIAAQ